MLNLLLYIIHPFLNKIINTTEKKNLLRIRMILKEFEREYLNDKERCKFDIKDKYLQRPSLDEHLVRKRVI